jgi:hypothetical protein
MYLFALAVWFAFQGPFAIPADYRPESPSLAIRRLQPAISKVRAEYLAKVFVRVSQRLDCQIPWQILVSIAFHESSIGLYTENEKSFDYGIMQINERTIRRLKLDFARVRKDSLYSITASCRIVRSNYEAYAHLPYWIGIYRSGTALWKPSIVRNAESYSRIILSTAEKLGYRPALEVAFAN